MKSVTPLLFAVATLLSVPPCSGQPALTAKKTVTLTEPGAKEPKVLQRALLYYDSRQRMRQEETTFDENGRPIRTVINIFDPVAQRDYTLNPAERKGEQRYFRPPSVNDVKPGQPGSQFPAGSFVVNPSGELGDQVVEGRQCYGTVYGESPVFNWQIVWWDKETGLPILRIQARKNGKILKTTITDIELQEPDSSLFYPPSDYVVKEARLE